VMARNLTAGVCVGQENGACTAAGALVPRPEVAIS